MNGEENSSFAKNIVALPGIEWRGELAMTSKPRHLDYWYLWINFLRSSVFKFFNFRSKISASLRESFLIANTKLYGRKGAVDFSYPLL
jgi:hypothetical protein